MKLKITWEVEDSYAGKSRPQFTIFNSDDYTNDKDEWNKLTGEEQREFIEESIQDDFNSKIHWCIINEKEI